MGIKSSKDITKWGIIRVKKFSDVIIGEKWSDFGFNYKMFDVSKIELIKAESN